jgi:hypothetical protein
MRKQGLLDGLDDLSAVVFTLYELITNNADFTAIPHWERNMDMVQSISEWTDNHELGASINIPNLFE